MALGDQILFHPVVPKRQASQKDRLANGTINQNELAPQIPVFSIQNSEFSLKTNFVTQNSIINENKIKEITHKVLKNNFLCEKVGLKQGKHFS